MKLLHRILTDAAFISDAGMSAIVQSIQSLCQAFGTSEFYAAEHPVIAKMRESLRPQASMANGGIAVIPISGVLSRKPDVFEMAFGGAEDSSHVLDMVQAAATNPDVKGVLLNIDSPGGFLGGGPEIADAVKSLGKPSLAWTGGQMGSLAYYIGSQADHVVASRSAQVGSVGVYNVHVDISKMLADRGVKVEVIKNKEADYKAIGVPGTSLTDSQREHLQERAQAFYDDFKGSVKGARPHVSDEALKGQCYSGAKAASSGLIDCVGDMNYGLAVLRSKLRAPQMTGTIRD